MNRAEYLKTWEALKRGEPVNLTPEQAAGFLRAQTLEQVRAGVEAAGREPQPITADALNGILTRYGGNFGIWALFTRIVQAYRITPDAFASGLADAYTMGRADRETALTCFNVANRRDIMNADDLAVFEGFPVRLRVYRGCSVEETRAGVFGLSWTLSRAIAEFFAWRFNAADTGRVVVSTEITRPDVLAYFNTRREQEIICNVEANQSQPVEVIAREPSALYWEYMNRNNANTPAV